MTPRVRLLLVGGGLLLLAAMALRSVRLSGQLDAERAGHDATREKLAAAVREGNRWKAAADAAETKLPVLQNAVRECQDREAQAAIDAAARKRIMEHAQPRERSPAEQKGVVDDATRKAAMDRLNRPL